MHAPWKIRDLTARQVRYAKHLCHENDPGTTVIGADDPSVRCPNPFRSFRRRRQVTARELRSTFRASGSPIRRGSEDDATAVPALIPIPEAFGSGEVSRESPDVLPRRSHRVQSIAAYAALEPHVLPRQNRPMSSAELGGGYVQLPLQREGVM